MFEYGQDIPLDTVPTGNAETAEPAAPAPSEYPFEYGREIYVSLANQQ